MSYERGELQKGRQWEKENPRTELILLGSPFPSEVGLSSFSWNKGEFCFSWRISMIPPLGLRCSEECPQSQWGSTHFVKVPCFLHLRSCVAWPYSFLFHFFRVEHSALVRISLYFPFNSILYGFKIIHVFICMCVGFPGGSAIKNPPANAEDVGSIPGSWRSPGEGNGNPLQYSCLGNPMDRGTWLAPVHGVAKESVMTQQPNYNNLFIQT